MTTPYTGKPSPAHRRMIEDLMARGLIARVGGRIEITDAGHAWTRHLTRHWPPRAREPSVNEP